MLDNLNKENIINKNKTKETTNESNVNITGHSPIAPGVVLAYEIDKLIDMEGINIHDIEITNKSSGINESISGISLELNNGLTFIENIDRGTNNLGNPDEFVNFISLEQSFNDI
jgi:hypothetical protein